MMKIVDKAWKWVDERLILEKEIWPLMKKPVPLFEQNPVYCLGGIAFLCYIVQIVTGIMLARYYVPSPEGAYESVKFIVQEVPLGSLFRSVHHWGANIMMAAVVLHMIRIYFMGAYKRPRELNWVVGATLLLMTMVFGFSGYLLPYDQLSYWATTVGLQMPAAIPVLGEIILNVGVGGTDVGATTLLQS